MNKAEHQWRFFRAGGFDQVCIENEDDLRALRSLDQKLWATLVCPIGRLALDEKMLKYLDVNNDGRIRAPELLAAIDWLLLRMADANQLFKNDPLTLSSFRDSPEGAGLKAAAKRLLHVLGKSENDTIHASYTADLSALFPANEANGDGLIPISFASDQDLARLIGEIIACTGGKIDRSGEPAVGELEVQLFYQHIAEAQGWLQSADESLLLPFAEHTAPAIGAIAALREKINDYFTRVAMASYDTRASAIMNAQEGELQRLALLNLAEVGELSGLPLAAIGLGQQGLPVTEGINPAYAAQVKALYEHAIVPTFGELTHLSLAQWQELLAKSEAYFAWNAGKPALPVFDQLSNERILEIAQQARIQDLITLIEQDKVDAQAADALVDLDKLLRLKDGFITLLRNYVSFQDFYGREDKAIFQAGRLYIDGKSCDLVIEVGDVGAHSAVAEASNSFLIYLNCVRRGQPIAGKESMNIVAVISAGVDHELMVGRNGLFYDRDGNDWDATIVKVVENAISVRQAFWSPYTRIANMISQQIQKFASSKDSELMTSATSNIEGAGAADASKPPFDIAKFAGIFAAIGLAVGAIGTALAAVFSGLLALEWWQWPLVLVGITFFISGPSMLLAWFKLRRRSLGPILDANGWAVNTQAKISIPFGASLTQLANLPKGSKRALADPFEEQKSLWPWLLGAAAIIGGAAWWQWEWLQSFLA